MSSATEQYIPDPSQVKITGSGFASWRFSEGKIVKGRVADGSLESTPMLVGRIVRIGIHEGVTDDQYHKPYMQLEADMETASGPVSVHCGLLDEKDQTIRPSMAAIGLGWGLTQITGEDLVAITSAQGEPWTDDRGRAMSGSTYVNFARLDPTTFVGTPIRKPKADRNAPRTTTREKWDELEPAIREHPLFGPRPARAANDDYGGKEAIVTEDEPSQTGRQAYEKVVNSKGWPDLLHAEAGHLELINKAGKTSYKALSEVPDATLAAMAEGAAKAKGVPKPLEPFVNAVLDTEVDVFA